MGRFNYYLVLSTRANPRSNSRLPLRRKDTVGPVAPATGIAEEVLVAFVGVGVGVADLVGVGVVLTPKTANLVESDVAPCAIVIV